MEAESFVLLSVENREILGVEPSHLNPEAAIVTVQNQGVYIYDVFDQQCKTSYLLSPGNSFTYYAVQNPNTKKFLAVKDKKYLCSWPEEQKDLKKIGRKAYDRGDIHSVWVDKLLGTHHAIIFADGAVSLGNPDLALMTNQESTPSSSGEVVWATLRRADSLLFVAVVTKANNDAHTLHIHSITRPEKALELSYLSSHKLNKPQKARLVTCAFDADALSFTAIWSTGEMTVWTVSSAEDLTSVNDSFASSVSRRLKMPKSNSGMMAIPVKASLLLVTHPTETTKQTLTMWDTNFGVVQSTKDISTDAEAQKSGGILASAEGSPLYVQQAAQSTDGSVVFLNLGSMVIVVPVWAPASSLANSIGRLEISKPFLAPQQHHSNQESQNFNWLGPVISAPASAVVEQSEKGDDEEEKAPAEKKKSPKRSRKHVESGSSVSDLDKLWQDHAVSRIQAESAAIASLKNKSKTPTFEAFMSIFNAFLSESKAAAAMLGKHKKTKTRHAWKDIAELGARQKKQKQKRMIFEQLRNNRVAVLSHNFVYQVALRCLEEDFLWEPLRVLIESSCLAVRQLPTFLPTLMEKNQLSLLVDTVQYVSDLAEVEIVTIAKYFMSQASSQSLQICVDECIAHRKRASELPSTGMSSDSDDMDVEPEPEDEFPQTPLERILNVIVCAPQNPLFMTQAARRFNTNELVILMQFLLRWLKFYKDNTLSQSILNNNILVPQLPAIIGWASLLVDAQISQMLYAQECRQLVLDLQVAITEHLKLCEALEALRGCLAHLHTRRHRSRKQLSDYTIETLL